MRKLAMICKTMTLVGTGGVIFGVTGSCLPENFFADATGDLLNGLIVARVNLVLAGVGIQV